jgi:copper(I)-binding protein
MFTILKKLTVAVTLAWASMVMSYLPSLANDYQVGDLVIQQPSAKATLPGAPVSGGYMLIKNNGDSADRLISASVDFAGKTEIHEMAMENDIMKMRELPDGIEIPAGGEIVLKPGSHHLMFMQLREQLKEGENRKATLTFEKAGTVEIDLSVETAAGQ